MTLWEATECHLVATRGNALRGFGSGGQSSTAEVSLGSGQVSDTGWKSLLFLKKWRGGGREREGGREGGRGRDPFWNSL